MTVQPKVVLLERAICNRDGAQRNPGLDWPRIPLRSMRRTELSGCQVSAARASATLGACATVALARAALT